MNQCDFLSEDPFRCLYLQEIHSIRQAGDVQPGFIHMDIDLNGIGHRISF